jgi:hypothetical protein
VAWYRVDPRFLRQPDPDGLTLAYVGHGERDAGYLLLHLDAARDVAGFELSYDRFLGGGELYATWDRLDGLRLGEVTPDGRAGTPGPRPAMSALVRYRQLSAAEIGRLLGYVERSAEPLAPHHHHAVVAVLHAALRDAGRLGDGTDRD